MSRMSDLDMDLETICRVMNDGEPSDILEFAEDSVARRINSVISDLDELVAMAVNPETVDLIEREHIAVGQILTRAQLVASMIEVRKPRLKVVRRG